MNDSFKYHADEKELVALLSDLVEINSINPYEGEVDTDAGGEAGMIGYISNYFDEIGVDYILQEVMPQNFPVPGPHLWFSDLEILRRLILWMNL